MSFQSKTEQELGYIVEDANKASPFENFIMQCCKADEWTLRKFLKKVLIRSGFQIFEDEYKSERVQKEKRYETVHNMLAIRGNPRVCLVAHTDVCRDHEELRSEGRYSSYGEHQFWMQGQREEEQVVRPMKKVDPVIKCVEQDGKIRRVIQDRDCKLQVGGDDRLGVAINTWIAINSGFDCGLYFPTDEEIGLKSARACEMPQLMDFDLLVQVDRGNHSNQLVIKISNEILVSYETATELLSIAYDLGMPREPVVGLATDVYALKSRGKCKEAVNLTCGYFNSHGAGAGEYIDIQEAKDTMKFVATIVKNYYMK